MEASPYASPWPSVTPHVVAAALALAPAIASVGACKAVVLLPRPGDTPAEGLSAPEPPAPRWLSAELRQPSLSGVRQRLPDWEQPPVAS